MFENVDGKSFVDVSEEMGKDFPASKATSAVRLSAI
jgi:hypothetical protein